MKNQKNFESIFQNAIDANIIIDSETGRIKEANKIALHIFQTHKSGLIGKNFNDLFLDDDDDLSRKQLPDQIPFHDNIEIRRYEKKEGEILSFEILLSIIPWNDSTALYASMRNVTEHRAAEEKLKKAYLKMEKLSLTDPLTKLANRRALIGSIKYEKNRFGRNREHFSMILCDIDDYKKINDTYGHDAGDFILKELSGLMKKSLRKQDIVGRWGGDEFLFLLPQTKIEGAKLLAEKLRIKIFKRKFIFSKKTIKLTMTFGVSHYTGKCNYERCITNADKALYQAKELGKNQVMVYNDL